jgi:L-threonylcarbamoyladenylate synthase
MIEKMGMEETRVAAMQTHIVQVNTASLGSFKDRTTLETWTLPTDGKDLKPLQEAAKHLKTSNIPVGFPTETVYGLGADATRSDAVKGIYLAKGRPSDNPLIIHICDLTMLRNLLEPAGHANGNPPPKGDPIPEIYKPLIKKFWPGPLTSTTLNPANSPLKSRPD